MSRLLRCIVVIFALVAVSWVAPRAQEPTGQKPPAAAAQAQPQPAAPQAKPAEIKPEDYPPDFKAFNEAAKEKDPLKRAEAFEKFVAAHPTSVLAGTARSQIQSNLLSTLKSSQKKYLDGINAQIEQAKSAPNTMVYTAYNRAASELFSGGIFLDEAEQFARTGLSQMNEQKYIEVRKQAAEAAAKRAAAPPAATPAPASAGGYSISMVDGVMVARPTPPRPPAAAPATPPPPPRIPTDEELRNNFKIERASAQATLGQILSKRGKQDEATALLKEAYAARPAAYTMATIARTLSEVAKKANDDKGQLEYLTALMLTGRITAAERQDLDAVYRKAHGGSLDGIEEMLDERYKRENPAMHVTPFARKSPSNGRVVLAEMFTGAG